MADPDWLTKAIADGTATAKGVNLSAFNQPPVLDRAPGVDDIRLRVFQALCEMAKDEADFQVRVVDFAHLLGWKVVHIRKVLVKMGDKTHYETPFAIDGAGSFDLDLYRERLIKVELKFGKNKPTKEQLAWFESYKRCGIESYIWYPKDCEQIIEVLSCHLPKTK